MRAWQIENWTKKKLRRSCWNKSMYCKYEPTIGWRTHFEGEWESYDKNVMDFHDLMSSDDVEEYIEPVVKTCKTCAKPCEFWLESGHTISGCVGWTDKKEELTMEKVDCTICKHAGSACNQCIHGFNYTHAKDMFRPVIPTKTKNLTWQEAYEAWNDGWEVEGISGGIECFDVGMQFSVGAIINVRYQLTGKRR